MSEKWTTKNIPELTGKVIIVTGANTGIGFEEAKEFTRKGAKTILACRNLEKGEKALAKILKEIPDAPAEIMHLDLANLDSVNQFSTEFKKKYDRLDVLVNNAGIMMVPYRKTVDGFESQIGTNHLGHFALTGLLYDLLTETEGARVVNVSSNGHRFGEIDYDSFTFDEDNEYSRMKAYGQSKLANLLFTYELDRRFKKGNINAIAVAAHPGMSNTNLADHMMGFAAPILKGLFGFIMQSAAKGALPTIRAAVDPENKGSEYYGPGGRKEQRGYPVRVESSKTSHNKEDAKKLWDLSEKLTKVKFGFA
ncbi:MAG: SDR family NAD(P)-dependent oxidoreductase [Candidatus Heimdallarchaeota archaeon]|nr:SDR family NAD(P)-dependent oxidoreductase [Candidatus Heimdallarchaeota archaeon]